MKKTLNQWGIMSILFIWGFGSFLILVSEEAEGAETTFGQYLLVKVLALISLALCLLCGKALKKRGQLPEIEE